MSKKLDPGKYREAVCTEEKMVRIPYDENEMFQHRDSLVRETLNYDAEVEEYKKKLEEVKAKLKERIKIIAEIKSALRSGHRQERMELYLVPNSTNGMMEYYTKAGEMIESRIMRPDERNMTIFNSAAGNDK